MVFERIWNWCTTRSLYTYVSHFMISSVLSQCPGEMKHVMVYCSIARVLFKTCRNRALFTPVTQTLLHYKKGDVGSGGHVQFRSYIFVTTDLH